MKGPVSARVSQVVSLAAASLAVGCNEAQLLNTDIGFEPTNAVATDLDIAGTTHTDYQPVKGELELSEWNALGALETDVTPAADTGITEGPDKNIYATGVVKDTMIMRTEYTATGKTDFVVDVFSMTVQVGEELFSIELDTTDRMGGTGRHTVPNLAVRLKEGTRILFPIKQGNQTLFSKDKLGTIDPDDITVLE